MEKSDSRYNRIVAFAGRKRSGKGMLAKGMQEYDPNTIIVTIADNLKFLCCDLLNVSYDTLNKMKDDGTTFELKADGQWVATIHNATGINAETILNEIGDITFTNVREMLQIIGTDLIRKYVPNWHIDKTIERIMSYDEHRTIVVDDVRFPNEKKAIEKIGGDVFFVIRPNNWEISNHPSETALTFEDFDAGRIIINDAPKENMVTMFNTLYFCSEFVKETHCPILLIANPWYMEHMMNVCDSDIEIREHERRTIAKLVLEQNKHRYSFYYNGIITFTSQDEKTLRMFRYIIMNDRRFSDGYHSYSIYNPLTNEILKKYM